MKFKMSFLYKKYPSYKNIVFQLVNKSGHVSDSSLLPKINNKDLIKAYTFMKKARQYDYWMLKWQRQGRTYGFLECAGQEALQIASAMHLIKGRDWLVPAFRSNAAWLWLGYKMEKSMLYWSGNEFGSVMPDGVNVLPVCIPIATQSSHAAGIAFAEKYKKTNGIVLSYIGDGGTSEGEFYESLNFSDVKELPIIYIIQNNQWALSTPNSKETKAINFAEKATAAGIKHIVVDGNDFFATYLAMQEAVSFARKNIPYVIECRTYRIGDHSTSDDSTVYRKPEYVKSQLETDPLIRLKIFLIKNKILTEELAKKIHDENENEIKVAFKKASDEKNNYKIDDIFDYTYNQLPQSLYNEKEELIKELKEVEDFKNMLKENK